MKNFLVIFLAVITANICTLVLYENYLLFNEQKAMEIEHLKVDSATSQKQTENSSPTEIVNQQEKTENAAEKSRRNESLEKYRRLCNYWTTQYNKEPTGLNLALKGKACLKYRKLQPATPSAE